MTLFAHQLRAEQLAFWRSRESAVFIFVFPLLLYTLLGAVYGEDIDGVAAANVLLAGLLGYGCANTAFAGLAISIVIRREYGILKRLRATPLPPVTYFCALIAGALLTFLAQTVTLIVLGKLLYDAAVPDRLLSLLVALAFGIAAFAGLGIGLAALIRSAEGSSAIVNVVLLPMAFLSGSFGPTRELPGWLQAIADVLPLKHYMDIVNGVVLDGRPVWDDATAVLVVAAWGLAGTVVAWRRFGWQPRDR